MSRKEELVAALAKLNVYDEEASALMMELDELSLRREPGRPASSEWEEPRLRREFYLELGPRRPAWNRPRAGWPGTTRGRDRIVQQARAAIGDAGWRRNSIEDELQAALEQLDDAETPLEEAIAERYIWNVRLRIWMYRRREAGI